MSLAAIYFLFRLTIPVTKSAKAGLLMPVARIRNQLKAGLYAKRIGTGAAGKFKSNPRKKKPYTQPRKK